MTCLHKNNGAVSCVGADLPRNNVTILLYIESIDGQFPLQTAAHSFSHTIKKREV